jgi:tetratricopeptide (TPR) repeat protein
MAQGNECGAGVSELLEIFGWICLQAGRFFCSLGAQYVQAQRMFEMGLECNLAMYCYANVCTAASFCDLGSVYKSQGKYEEALGCHSKALQIQLKVLRPEHTHVAAHAAD